MSGRGLLDVFIWLIVAGLVYWLVIWVLGELGLPEPFNKILRVLAAVVAFVIVVNALLSLAGHRLLW